MNNNYSDEDFSQRVNELIKRAEKGDATVAANEYLAIEIIEKRTIIYEKYGENWYKVSEHYIPSTLIK